MDATTRASQRRGAVRASRPSTGALLSQARDDPARLLYPLDAMRAPRSFVVSLAKPIGPEARPRRGSFVSNRAQTSDFYHGIVQELRALRPRAPRIARTARARATAAGTDASAASVHRSGRSRRRLGH
jgi:hypothetical protein